MVKKDEKFIIGLGNPEKKYFNTRHNVGFLVIESLFKKYNLKPTLKSKIKSYYSSYTLNETKYNLFMPNTYMNKSGDAIRALINWYGIDLDQILIIVDDIDLPLGKIRFRKKGGSGGHNGLKSIINATNSEDFKRIRVGIGKPPEMKDDKLSNTVSHVLGYISEEEKKILNKIFERIILSLEKLKIDNEDSIICELNSFKYLEHK